MKLLVHDVFERSIVSLSPEVMTGIPDGRISGERRLSMETQYLWALVKVAGSVVLGMETFDLLRQSHAAGMSDRELAQFLNCNPGYASRLRKRWLQAVRLGALNLQKISVVDIDRGLITIATDAL